MPNEIRPNRNESAFLNLAYNRFYDIFEEVFKEEFWKRDPYYRFMKIKNAFEVYSEIMNYEPVKWVIDSMKENRPPMESELGGVLFKSIRNILSHFPFFDSWEEVWINASIINWYRNGQSVDKFFRKYSGIKEVKYRIWEPGNKKMTYVTIRMPEQYNEQKIFLDDIISEKDGVKFCFVLMRKIIDTQVDNT